MGTKCEHEHIGVSEPIPERKAIIKQLKKSGNKEESTTKKTRASTKKEC